jgi:hypothetical protein
MNIKETLKCGYYDEDNGKDYIVEIDVELLKDWFKQEGLDLLDFESDISKKIAVYNILEENFTKDIIDYRNFTVKFI